ncbi:MAG TPA: 30S ribosomal protein THX [Bacteroidetes bacterium]|nr:30S ribosomal protein THX [Bacteroidota bacterium]
MTTFATNKNLNQINKIMGRGDKRSAKGKRFKGSYGNSRPQRAKKNAPAKTAAPAPAKKTAKKAATKKKAE